MIGRAHTRRGVVEFAGLGQRHELRHVFCRHIGVDHQHLGHIGQQCEALHVESKGADSFLGVGAGLSAGPAKFTFRIRAPQAGEGRIALLGAAGGTELLSVPYAVAGEAVWQTITVELNAKQDAAILRLYLPAGSAAVEVTTSGAAVEVATTGPAIQITPACLRAITARGRIDATLLHGFLGSRPIRVVVDMPPRLGCRVPRAESRKHTHASCAPASLSEK